VLGALRAVLFAPEDLALVRGPLLVAGVGSGVFIAANADFIVATVESADAGAASGVIVTMQRVGSASGIAVIGTVLFGSLHIHPVAAGPALAFGHSAALATAVSAGLSIAAFVLGFLLPQRVSAPAKTSRSRGVAGGRPAADTDSVPTRRDKICCRSV
jgi:hypothetical protein